MKELNTTNRSSKAIASELNSKFRALNNELRAYKSVVNANKKETMAFNKEILKLSKSIEGMSRKTDKLESELGQLKSETNSASDSMFRFSNVAKGVLAALSVRSVLDFSDSISKSNNQLKAVTTSTEQYNLVQLELNRIALDTRQNVNELTSVYARFSRAGQEAGFTQKEVLDLTESLTKAFKIEGNTTAEVNSVLLQLTQSFRSGVIQGEEFRAVSESSTLVLQALSKSTGVAVGELKKLASEGGITARSLIDGLKGMNEEIDNEFKNLAPTFAEVGAQMGNVFSMAFRQSGASELVNDITSSLNEGLKAVAFGMSESGKLITTQFDLMQKIGVDSLNVIKSSAKEIATLRDNIRASTDPKAIKEFSEKIDLLKKAIQEEAGKASFFERNFGEVGSLITQFSLLTIKAEEAKKKIESVGGDKKPEAAGIVKLGGGAKDIIKQGLVRLGLIESQAKKELQLLQEVADKKISQAEANATKGFERESGKLDALLAMTLKKAKISAEAVSSIKEKASAEGVSSLNADEKAVFDLLGEFAGQQKVLAENLQVELGVIQEKGQAKKLEIEEEGARAFDEKLQKQFDDQLEKEREQQKKLADARTKKKERDTEIITEETGRLDTIRAEAELELELLQEVAEERLSQAEANAIISDEAEIARLNENFENQLESLGINREILDELEFAHREGELEKLTAHEEQLLALKQTFADAELALRITQDVKLDKIRDKAQKHKAKVEEIAERNRFNLVVNSGIQLLNFFGKNSKTISDIAEKAAKVQIVADTAAAAAKALKNGGGAPWGLIPMAATITAGAAQFAAVGSGSVGGSGGNGGDIAGPDIDAVIEQAPQDDTATRQDVDVSVIGEDNTTSSTRTEISFNADSGGTAEAAIGELLNDMSRRGALTTRQI